MPRNNYHFVCENRIRENKQCHILVSVDEATMVRFACGGRGYHVNWEDMTELPPEYNYCSKCYTLENIIRVYANR
jgi:hypothetical protein